MVLYIKRFTVILTWLAILGTVALPQQNGKATPAPPPSAQQILDAATKTAKAENKTILVHFGASW